MTCAPRKQSKTYKVPKRPYEAARLDAELKVGFNYFKGGWRYCRVGWTYVDTGRLDKGISHGKRDRNRFMPLERHRNWRDWTSKANSALPTYFMVNVN
jgi:hypothetical protein